MRLRSFRTRLLVAIFGCAATAIIAGGIFTYAMARHHLYHQFDHFLGDKLRFHRVSCVQEGKRFRFKLPVTAWRRIHDPQDPEYFQFRFLDGRELFHSYSIPDGAGGLPVIGVGTRTPEAQDCILPNGNPGRALGVTFVPSEREAGDPEVEINLVVAHQRGELIAALVRLRKLIYICGTVAALLLLGATLFIVRQLLRPLASLTDQIGDAPLGDEDGAFTLTDPPKELEPVVDRLNALMARVRDALENERQFTSNAAHELRNPLAGLRSQVELALASDRDPERDEDTLVNVLEVQRQMEGAVENLLALARLDSGREAFSTALVDFNALARRAWKPYFDRASERNLRLRWDAQNGLPEFQSSPRLIEILAANLFDNATTYAPEGSGIHVHIDGQAGDLHFSVTNENPGISASEADEFFQRFHRGRQTTTGSRQHAGIGLSLCRKIAETLGGSIRASADDQSIEISVRLPISPQKNSEEKI